MDSFWILEGKFGGNLSSLFSIFRDVFEREKRVESRAKKQGEDRRKRVEEKSVRL